MTYHVNDVSSAFLDNVRLIIHVHDPNHQQQEEILATSDPEHDRVSNLQNARRFFFENTRSKHSETRSKH
jgi:hypothetical protein